MTVGGRTPSPPTSPPPPRCARRASLLRRVDKLAASVGAADDSTATLLAGYRHLLQPARQPSFHQLHCADGGMLAQARHRKAPLMIRHDRRLSSDRSFPFSPRSAARLRPGDFWALPLSDGRFGCAVVTDVAQAGPASRSAFVVGLTDWVGQHPPSQTDATQATIFTQGLTHVRALTQTGAEVLGNVRLPKGLDVGKNLRSDELQAGDILNVYGWRALAAAIEKRARVESSGNA